MSVLSRMPRPEPPQVQLRECICSWCGAILGSMTYRSMYPSFGICPTCIRIHFAHLFDADERMRDEQARSAARLHL